MRFAIITHVVHGTERGSYFAYAPYVREMNIWLKSVDEVTIVAPLSENSRTAIQSAYVHPKIHLKKVPAMKITSLLSVLKSTFQVPIAFITILKAMKAADHIHLRCPGNIGLLGCFAQIFYPMKIKTAKYAGNWDPQSKQPFSYRLQRIILNNTFLSRNIQVLVYGEWKGSSKNIKPFFTATYAEADKIPIPVKSSSNTTKFLFVGSLSPGKRPMYAIEIIKSLFDKGSDVSLDIYGDGAEYEHLAKYISTNQLSAIITLHGNQNEAIVRTAYQNSHFLILPSKSEGWPKVVAEAMFWGCIPVASSVSCVPYMLNHGQRGLLLKMELASDVAKIHEIIDKQTVFEKMSAEAMSWSRDFTVDKFESEINKLLMQ